MATTNGLTPSQNGRIVGAIVTENDLQEMEDLLRDLQGRCDKAREDGRIFMMQQYVQLVALVSPEIDRIQRRFKRETLASFRKEHKRLKLEAKEAAETAAESA
jgi:hypothetical protein